jgi:replicative DNA helicase
MRIQEIMPFVLSSIEDIHESLLASIIKTGYKELDEIICGLYPGEVGVVSGVDELCGSFVQNIIINQLKDKPDSSILVVCPKMEKEKYVMSLLSIGSEIPLSSISLANPPLDQGDRNRIALSNETLIKSNIQISRDRTIAIRDGLSKFEEQYSASTLDLIVIDDLDSISFKAEENPQPTDQSNKNIKTIKPTREIIVTLKISILNDIARKFHVPVLAVYGGSIDELDSNSEVNVVDSFFSYADLVLEIDDNPLRETGTTDIHIKKNKYGQTGRISLFYCDEFTCFDS